MFRYYTTPTTDLLADLAYELSDADDDSARLARDLVEAECWQTHACRPRDLQRAACEALATLREEAKSSDISPADGARRRRLSLERPRSRARKQPFGRAFGLRPVRPAT
jgi:hypothetical protein